jgi:hypothetical protein
MNAIKRWINIQSQILHVCICLVHVCPQLSLTYTHWLTFVEIKMQ